MKVLYLVVRSLQGAISQRVTVRFCVQYVDPPERVGADAEISWWTIDDLVGSEVELALDAFIPQWIRDVWPLTSPRYVGRDLSWKDWLALPELEPPE